MSQRGARKADFEVNLELLDAITDEYGDIFHEWHTDGAQRFFKDSIYISERNWTILMLHTGLAGQGTLSYGKIANLYDIGRCRVSQICEQTKKNLVNFVRNRYGMKSC